MGVGLEGVLGILIGSTRELELSGEDCWWLLFADVRVERIRMQDSVRRSRCLGYGGNT